MTEWKMKPSEVAAYLGGAGIGPNRNMPNGFNKAELEWAAILVICYCEQNGNKWQPIIYEDFVAFLGFKMTPREASNPFYKPDLLKLIADGYLDEQNDGDVKTSTITPTEKFVDHCAEWMAKRDALLEAQRETNQEFVREEMGKKLGKKL